MIHYRHMVTDRKRTVASRHCSDEATGTLDVSKLREEVREQIDEAKTRQRGTDAGRRPLGRACD